MSFIKNLFEKNPSKASDESDISEEDIFKDLKDSERTKLNSEKLKMATTAIVGNMPAYLDGEDIERYLKAFEVFLTVNNVTDEKLRTQWLMVYGGKVLNNMIETVLAPLEPEKVEFKTAKPKLINYMKKNVDVGTAKQLFYQRVQKQGESICEFALALKELSSTCDFGTHLDVILRDRFIYNLSDVMVCT